MSCFKTNEGKERLLARLFSLKKCLYRFCNIYSPISYMAFAIRATLDVNLCRITRLPLLYSSLFI
jgi:hypothetical protein